jgi:hypothetical protein
MIMRAILFLRGKITQKYHNGFPLFLPTNKNAKNTYISNSNIQTYLEATNQTQLWI